MYKTILLNQQVKYAMHETILRGGLLKETICEPLPSIDSQKKPRIKQSLLIYSSKKQCM